MSRRGWAWAVGGLQAMVGGVAVSLVRRRADRVQRELTGILAGLADAVHVHDAEGRTVYANQAAAELIGLPAAEIVGATRGELASRFDITDEHGRPVGVDDFPGYRIFAGKSAQPLLARSVDRKTGEEMWTLTKASAILGPDGRPVLAVNVIEDVTEAKRAELAARLLARAGEVLGASLELETTLDRLAGLAVPQLADWCGVDLPGATGRVEPVAVAHTDPDRVAVARELRARYPIRIDDPTGLGEVLRGGPTVVSQDIEDADLAAYASDPDHLRLLRAIGFRHLIVVGMRAPGTETVGTLTLVRGPGRPPFGAAEITLAEELARRAGTAVLNARLYRAQRTVAETLQRSLLPPALPAVPGLPMAAYYRPAGHAGEDVGGDFYDAFPLPDGWLLAIGDVTGKGAAAAAVTGLARAALEAVTTLTGRPELALAHLDGLLARRGELGVATAALVHLRLGEAGLTAAVRCAGHPPPLLLRRGELRELEARGPVLGALPEPSWPEAVYALEPGDVLVLHTDGVTDTAATDGERLGGERLHALLAGVPAGDPQAAVDAVREALGAHAPSHARDDVAVLAVGVGELAPAAPDRPAPRLPVGSARVELPATPASVRRARRAVEDALRGRLGDRALDEARLMVSELASNAVRHGGGTYVVDVELDARRLRVAVTDRGDGFRLPPPAAVEPPLLRENGRGLAIVDRLASRWGIDRARHGTCVWFELDR